MAELSQLVVESLEAQGLKVAVPWQTPDTTVVTVQDPVGGGGVAVKLWTAERLMQGGNMAQVGAAVAVDDAHARRRRPSAAASGHYCSSDSSYCMWRQTHAAARCCMHPAAGAASCTLQRCSSML